MPAPTSHQYHRGTSTLSITRSWLRSISARAAAASEPPSSVIFDTSTWHPSTYLPTRQVFSWRVRRARQASPLRGAGRATGGAGTGGPGRGALEGVHTRRGLGTTAE